MESPSCPILMLKLTILSLLISSTSVSASVTTANLRLQYNNNEHDKVAEETGGSSSGTDMTLFGHCPNYAATTVAIAAPDDDDDKNVDPPLKLVNKDDDAYDDKQHIVYTRTWIPGYPGSGSEMLRTIIQELTGLGASNTYTKEKCSSSDAISCKTHYPVLDNRSDGSWMTPPSGHVPFSDGYFLLLRNPALAIPSYFNYLWESKHHSITDHTTQAPINDWREWRDKEFVRQVNKWVNIIRTWDDDSPLTLTLYLPFERLVDPMRGPELVLHMSFEFARVNSISLDKDPTQLDADRVPCLWKKLVLDHPSKKRSSSYIPGYRTEQKQYMLKALDVLLAWAKDRPADITGTRLVDILEGYRDGVKESLIIDDE